MANLGITLKQLMKSVKKGTHPLANYMKFEREMSNVPFHMPITGDEVRRARNIVNPIDTKKQKVNEVIHTNTGKYDKEATKFLKKSGYNKKGEFDVGEINDDVIHNKENFIQALYDKFYQDLTKNQETSSLYLEDKITSNRLLKSLLMREKLLQYTKTKDPQIYQELATTLHEYPTRNVEQRYKQVSNWLKRADNKYKEIVNPSGQKRQLSYANRRYTNMNDPIQGDTFNEDFDMFDLEDYIQRENITNPYLKSYLEAELQKLNPNDAYDAEIIRQLEQKL